jgi:hypothetical protein
MQTIFALARCRDLYALLLRRVRGQYGVAGHDFFSITLHLRLVNERFRYWVTATHLGQPVDHQKFLADVNWKQWYFVPITLDYGIPMRHQGGMWITPQQTRLIYEPYGTYEKFGVSYRKEFMDAFDAQQTWHEYNGIREGLQSILLRRTSSYAEFADELRQIDEAQLGEVHPAAITPSGVPSGPTHTEVHPAAMTPSGVQPPEDMTLRSMHLLTYLEQQMPRDVPRLRAAYALFNKYTAKSCVTLSLVEMMHRDRIHDFYARVNRAPYPSQFINDVLMQRLSFLPLDFDITKPITVECDRLTGH